MTRLAVVGEEEEAGETLDVEEAEEATAQISWSSSETATYRHRK